MSTAIIVIDRINKINQFRSIPKAFTIDDQNYRIVTTNEVADSSKFPLNFYDLKISPVDGLPVLDYSGKGINYNPITKTAYLERYFKDFQSHFLNTYVAGSKLAPDYLALPFKRLNMRGDMQITNLWEFENKCVVIKPLGGARSLGIMYADLSEVNIRFFLEDFWKMLKDNVAITQSYVDLCKKHNITLECGGERVPNEMATYFIHPETDFMIQECNPFAKSKSMREFRLIKSLDEVVLICDRQHLNNSDTTVEQILSFEELSEIIDSTDRVLLTKQIRDVIASPNFPMTYGSLDLWVDTEGKSWGFYEFQDQYGFKFLPEAPHVIAMTRFIHNLYMRTKHITFSL